MTMALPLIFFETIKLVGLFPSFSQEQVNGLNTLTEVCADATFSSSYAAYALATTYHETARTMQPIRERGGDAYFTRMYDPSGARPSVARALGNTKVGDGARYAGRGYVQITGRRNYSVLGAKLHAHDLLDAPDALLEQPDRAMEPKIAAAILVYGMREGLFTGPGLLEHLNPSGCSPLASFVSARRIINGTDAAEAIAKQAMLFQAALTAAGYAHA
jgi:putative chitinase